MVSLPLNSAFPLALWPKIAVPGPWLPQQASCLGCKVKIRQYSVAAPKNGEKVHNFAGLKLVPS
jgi:hypothetical protein